MGKPSTTVVISEHYQDLARQFYEHQLSLGYVQRSSRTHWHKLREFLSYVETHLGTELSAVSTENVLQFYQYQKERPSKTNGQPLQAKTLFEYILIIQSFYTMLQHRGQTAINPASTIRIPYPKRESPRTALTQDEIKVLYKHCQSYKERAILALGYGCGLRVSELAQCNIEDIRLRDQVLIVPKGKGNKSRTIPMSKRVVKDLSSYLYKVRLHQESQDDKAFILHSRGGRMRKHTYNKILQELIERTGNASIIGKGISIHNLRHSIATHLIEQGVPIEKVKEFLGHSELESTEVYTHISQKQLEALVT